MKKFKLPALLLAVFLLASCGTQREASGITSSSAPQASVPQPDTREHSHEGENIRYNVPPPHQDERYIVETANGDVIVSHDGEVILRGTGLSILYDNVTGAPAWLASHSTSFNSLDNYRLQGALYTLNGELLIDWQDIGYFEHTNGWLCRHFADNSSDLYNPLTGESIWQGHYSFTTSSTGYTLVTEKGYMVAVLDSGMQPLLLFEEEVSGMLLMGSYLRDGNGPYTLHSIEPGLPLALEGEYASIEEFGGYIATKAVGNALSVQRKLLDAATLEPAFSALAREKHSIRDFDGERLLLTSTGGDVLYSAEGSVLAEYPSIYPVQYIEGGTRYSAFDDEGFYLLCEHGEVLYSYTAGGRGFQLAPNRFIVQDGDELIILDGTLNEINRVTGEYYTADRTSGLFTVHSDMPWSSRQLYNAEGELLADSIQLSYSGYEQGLIQLGNGRVMARKGLRIGMMDETGEWLYSESIFSALEEEMWLEGAPAPEAPKVDGSTATLPLIAALYADWYGISIEQAEQWASSSGTYSSWQNLLNGESDLLLSYEAPEDFKQINADRLDEMEIQPIGMDALVFITHADNPVKSLTTAQLIGIYTGQITNWAEVGGNDEPIIAYQRNETSGSQTLLRKLLLGDVEPMEAPTQIVNGMAALIEQVAGYSNEGGALGFSVYYYASEMYQNPDIKLLAVDGVQPSAEAIAEGSYPLINEFYAAIRAGEPNDSITRQLYNWLLTEEGAALLRREGYVPVEK